MTYSCSDFTDSILEALSIHIPEEEREDPGAQMVRAVAEIRRLQNAVARNSSTPRRKRRPARRPKNMSAAELRQAGMHLGSAIERLQDARNQLTKAAAHNAADYVRRALKSAEGAARHNWSLYTRKA